MPRAAILRCMVLCALALGSDVGESAVAGLPGQSEQQPTFRSRVTLVPLDVRVLDERGRPVTDLRQDDFTVVENGKRQEIRHFETCALTPQPADPAPLVPRPVPTLALGSTNRRVFVLMLGDVWLPTVRREYNVGASLLRFVRERLLPQDYVGFSAFSRATDMTTDHAAVARVIERVDAFEQALQLQVKDDGGERARELYTREVKHSEVRAEFEEIFSSGGGRALPTGEAAANSLAPSLQGMLDELLQRLWTSAPVGDRSRNYPTRKRIVELCAVLQYLRHIEGEKHLVWVPGFTIPPTSWEAHVVATLANDARVALHTLYLRSPQGQQGWDTLAIAGLRDLSLQTGGSIFTGSSLDEFFLELSEQTRAGYLLGYYPADARFDGRYRTIDVKVKRPKGAIVQVRHGYFAREHAPALDLERLVAQDRIYAAAASDIALADLRTTIKASAAGNTVAAEVTIDLSRVAFKDVDGHQVATLQLTVFCGDARQSIVGEEWKSLALNLSPETYARVGSEGLRQRVEVAVKSPAKWVKAIVYDPGSDLLGTASVRLR